MYVKADWFDTSTPEIYKRNSEKHVKMLSPIDLHDINFDLVEESEGSNFEMIHTYSRASTEIGEVNIIIVYYNTHFSYDIRNMNNVLLSRGNGKSSLDLLKALYWYVKDSL